jgi:hypothetical protein
MSTKLNSYTLPDETIDSMKYILSKSVQESSEFGFTLCSDQKNNLHARDICAGEACTVNIEGKCDKEEKFAGTYHTHPASHSFASTGDLIHCGVVPNICIGGKEDNKMRCYTWKHNHITAEKYNELVGEYNIGKKQIDDHLHEKTFECMKEFGPIIRIEKMVREEDKKIDLLFSLISMAEQVNTPKNIVDKMRGSLKPLLDERRKVVNDIHKSSAELIPKYYKENILD